MKQARLFREPRPKAAKIAKDFDKGNWATALEILESPGQHGGVSAFPCTWARLVVARLERRAAA